MRFCVKTGFFPRGRAASFGMSRFQPEVGDNVTLRLEESGEGYIEKILPRKNLLIRPPLANLDLMLITAAAAKPAPSLSTLDKLSAICVHADVLPVFVITKCDIDHAAGARLAKVYRRSGFQTFEISALTGAGTAALRAYLEKTLPGKDCGTCGCVRHRKIYAAESFVSKPVPGHRRRQQKNRPRAAYNAARRVISCAWRPDCRYARLWHAGFYAL